MPYLTTVTFTDVVGAEFSIELAGWWEKDKAVTEARRRVQ
jgi:hypothetical protein